MVYKTEDTMYGYKAVFVCKKDKPTDSYQLLRVPGRHNIICAVIKIEIPKGTIFVDPWGQENNGDYDYHKLRCACAKFVETVRYCCVHVGEKIDESIINDNALELNFNAAINAYLVEVSEKEVIDYNKSKDIKYCSMYVYDKSYSLTDANILEPNDFMRAYPFLDTNDSLICAPGIHFFKTEEEVYNYLIALNS